MRFIKLGLLGVLTVFSATAHAQYPKDTVTMVVPAAAGGSTDVIGRYVAEGLHKAWGVPVVVDNKPGAGSTVGTVHALSLPADGNTLLAVSSALTTGAVLDGNKAFNPQEDLSPVAMVAASAYVLVAGPKSGISTIEEFKAHKEELFYGAVGVGSSTHFGSELLFSQLGLKGEPVFYKSGSEVVVDLIGGRLDVYLGTFPALAAGIQAGQIKALAVTGPEREAAYPDVPTLTESGVATGPLEAWWALFARKGTDPAILDKITTDVNAILSTDDAKAFFTRLGARPVVEPAAYLGEVVADDMVKWTRVKEEAGIKAE